MDIDTYQFQKVLILFPSLAESIVYSAGTITRAVLLQNLVLKTRLLRSRPLLTVGITTIRLPRMGEGRTWLKGAKNTNFAWAFKFAWARPFYSKNVVGNLTRQRLYRCLTDWVIFFYQVFWPSLPVATHHCFTDRVFFIFLKKSFWPILQWSYHSLSDRFFLEDILDWDVNDHTTVSQTGSVVWSLTS